MEGDVRRIRPLLDPLLVYSKSLQYNQPRLIQTPFIRSLATFKRLLWTQAQTHSIDI